MTPQYDQHEVTSATGSTSVIEIPRVRANGRGDISEEDAATYLACSTRYLRKMRASDEGPNWRTVAGRIWYPLAALDEYLEACTHVTTR